LLAHYHELDFAMSYNVPPNLLRISVGLENPNVLKSKFEEAFAKSQLYPKLRHSTAATSLSSSNPQRRLYSSFSRQTMHETTCMKKICRRQQQQQWIMFHRFLKRVSR
jgi:hypothetical protein